MSIAQKMLTAIQNGRAHVEQFYDGAIVESGMKGADIVLKGSVLFAALSASIGAAPELAALSMGHGGIEAYAVASLKNAIVGGAAWTALSTGAAALSHYEQGTHKKRVRP